MAQWQLENVHTGHVLGIYDGDDEAEALDAMARDAGYSCHEEAPGDRDSVRATRVADVRGETYWCIEARRPGGEWSAEPIGPHNEFASEGEAGKALDSWLENVDDRVPVEDGGWEYRVVAQRREAYRRR